MAYEVLDRGAIKVVASVNTANAAVLGQGVQSALGIRDGETRLTLREPMAAGEVIFWGNRADAGGGEVRVIRRSDTEYDVQTLDAGGNIEAGVALVFIARVSPLAAVGDVTPPAQPAGVLTVNNVTGSDAATGTPTDPLLSYDEALRRATAGGAITQPLVIVLQQTAIDYVQTIEIPPAALSAPLFTMVDETFGTPFDIIDTQVSQAGTTGSQIVGVGLVNFAHEGQFIRFTDGAAVGQRRQIRSNTATNIQPVRDFNPAPAPGDTFEIFTPNVRLDLSAFADGERCSNLFGPDAANQASGSGPAAKVYVNLTLADSAPVWGGHMVVFYGCDWDAPVSTQQIMQGGHWLAGCDSYLGFGGASADLPVLLGAAADAFLGYGCTFLSTGLAPTLGRLTGYVVARDVVIQTQALFEFLGGLCLTEAAAGIPLFAIGDGARVEAGAFFGLIPAQVNRRAAAGAQDEAILVQEGARFEIPNVRTLDLQSQAAGISVRVGAFGKWRGTDGITGGKAAASDAVRALDGAQVFIIGAPAFGDAVNLDYTNGDGAPVNKGFFGAIGTAKHFSAGAQNNGALIERVLL